MKKKKRITKETASPSASDTSALDSFFQSKPYKQFASPASTTQQAEIGLSKFASSYKQFASPASTTPFSSQSYKQLSASVPATLKIRAACLKLSTIVDRYSPPSARRKKRLKDAIQESPLLKLAMMLFDFNLRRPYGEPAPAEEVHEVLGDELERGIAEVDPEVFRTLARAAERAKAAWQYQTAHAEHVRAAKLAAAEFFEKGIQPTKQQVIQSAIAKLKEKGRAAYPAVSASQWTSILRDAGLTNLAKDNPGGIAKKRNKRRPPKKIRKEKMRTN